MVTLAQDLLDGPRDVEMDLHMPVLEVKGVNKVKSSCLRSDSPYYPLESAKPSISLGKGVTIP